MHVNLTLSANDNGRIHLLTFKRTHVIKKLFIKILLKALDDPEIKKAIVKIIIDAINRQNRHLYSALRSL